MSGDFEVVEVGTRERLAKAIEKIVELRHLLAQAKYWVDRVPHGDESDCPVCAFVNRIDAALAQAGLVQQQAEPVAFDPSEAMRLADALEQMPGYDFDKNYCEAAAELRRLAGVEAKRRALRDDILFQLLAAANYIDALGGDSKSYRVAIAIAKVGGGNEIAT